MIHPLQSSLYRAAALHLAAAMLVVGLLVAPTTAEPRYQTKQVDSSLRSYGLTAKRYAKSPSADEAEREKFFRYLLAYYLPSMTQADAESLGELGKQRRNLFRSFIWPADPAIQAELTRLVMREMSSIAVGRGYHPAVQYNAILILGLLDATYADNLRGQAPIPDPTANLFLCKVIDQGIENPAAPVHLVIGALVGVERHARVLSSLPEKNQQATLEALLHVLQTEKIPHDIAPEVEQWIKVLAARSLAATGQLGEGNRVHQALLGLLGDETVAVSHRVQIASKLDQLAPAYRQATGMDEKQVADTLLTLATAIASDEQQRASEYEAWVLAGGLDRQNEDLNLPDPYQIRRLVMRLQALDTAIRTLAPTIQSAPLKARMAEVANIIGPVLSQAQDERAIAFNLVSPVTQMARNLNGLAESSGIAITQPEGTVVDNLLGG